MNRAIAATLLAACAGCLAFGQTAEAPQKFEIADIHPSARSAGQRSRSTSVHNDRYVVKDATMVDLVGMAYGFAADKVLSGPNWLEMDRFDVTAKMP